MQIKQDLNDEIKKDFDIKMVQNETLVEKITQEIRDYIIENYSSGEKIPSNLELAKIFKVSIKTIHDSIKILSKENFLYNEPMSKHTSIKIGGPAEVFIKATTLEEGVK